MLVINCKISLHSSLKILILGFFQIKELHCWVNHFSEVFGERLCPISNLCCCLVTKSCPTFLWPNGPLGSSVCEISQARILKWVAISYYRGYPSPRNWTHVSCIGRQILYHWATGEARVNTWHSLILFFRDKHDSYLLLFP